MHFLVPSLTFLAIGGFTLPISGGFTLRNFGGAKLLITVLSFRQLSCCLRPGTVSRVTTASLSIAFQATPLTFYDNRDNRNNGLIVNSMLSVDNNKNNFYQPKGWLPLETC